MVRKNKLLKLYKLKRSCVRDQSELIYSSKLAVKFLWDTLEKVDTYQMIKCEIKCLKHNPGTMEVVTI